MPIISRKEAMTSGCPGTTRDTQTNSNHCGNANDEPMLNIVEFVFMYVTRIINWNQHEFIVDFPIGKNHLNTTIVLKFGACRSIC